MDAKKYSTRDELGRGCRQILTLSDQNPQVHENNKERWRQRQVPRRYLASEQQASYLYIQSSALCHDNKCKKFGSLLRNGR